MDVSGGNMNKSTKLLALLSGVVLAAAACTSSGGASSAPTSAPSAAAPSAAAPSTGASAAPSQAAASVDPNSLLGKVLAAGTLRISTDKNYAPQSFLSPDNKWTGFDIDVGTEIAKRLGVKADFKAIDWDVITAGGWAGRWDVSIGSMTITIPRQKILDFTSAYYYTPAQMTATKKSGITTLEGLAGKTVCVGVSTTYEDWLKGTLESVSIGPVATPPAGVKIKTETSDNDCAEFMKSGRDVGEGFLTSSTVADSSIANGTPIIKVGDPVYIEQLAASTDKKGPDATSFIAAVSKIIDDMHADGTLTTLSKKWFDGQDLTTKPAG
jgi:polar amino acid transport system substrate-binding protein